MGLADSGLGGCSNEKGVEHDGHENAVANLIGRVVRHLRPNVRIYRFDRISRSQHFASKTFEAFRQAGVEFLFFEGADGVDEIRFGGNDPDDKFFDLARHAHGQLKVVVTESCVARRNLRRRNKWFLGAPSAPFGLTMDRSKSLVVEPSDQASLEIILRGYANDESDADIARRLVAMSPVRRRRGEEGWTHRERRPCREPARITHGEA